MAENNRIVLQIQVDDKGVVKTLKDLRSNLNVAGVAGKDLGQVLKALANNGFQPADIKVKKLSSSLKEEATSANQAASANKKLETSTKGLAAGADKAAVSNKNLAKSNSDLSTSTQGVSKSSGAAAATTLELGRVISDMPYGIRGVSNNLSQVASQMAFMARGTDAVTGKVLGLGGAFKAIGAQIAGPLGFLLLIQGVIAAVDFFAGGMKKAETSVSDLDLQIKKLNESLWIQKQLLGDDSTEALENYFATIEQHIELLREQKELQDLDIKSKERLMQTQQHLFVMQNN